MRKYSSNEKTILDARLTGNENLEYLIKINDQQELKTLGLMWNSTSGTLQYAINIKFNNDKVTKRTILSNNRTNIAPTVITAKLILQLPWQLSADWDESIPTEIELIKISQGNSRIKRQK